MNVEDLHKRLTSAMAGRYLSSKDVTGIDPLSRTDIELIMDCTRVFKLEFIPSGEKKLPLLQGRSIINFFFEPSTRTRTSFELAGKALGADTINISADSSSMNKKNETLNDTARTLNAMHADCITLRHSSAGTPMMIARMIKAAVINAGDGMHEHPTQALLDLYTIIEKRGRAEGLDVVIVGDILHSRVAGSLIRILRKFNANIRLAAPPTMLPAYVERFGVKTYHDFDEAIAGADVVYALRVQLERSAAAFIPTLREYSKRFCVNMARLRQAAEDAIVMHPGPINREVDLSSEVMESRQSVVEEQVTNGLAVRLALLSLLIRPREDLAKQTRLTGRG